MRDLIARIEAAAGPDRALDAEISVAVGRGDHETHVIEYTDGRSQRVPWRPGGLSPDIECRRYTSSIDSALTLVPEGWDWTAWTRSDGIAEACLEKGDTECWGAVGVRRPALALCAAALRARLAMQEAGDA